MRCISHLIVLLPVYLTGQLVISEVQFKQSSPNEFVEIYNLSDIPVSVEGWEIADNFSVDQLSGDDLMIPGNGWAVILEGDYDGVLYQNLILEETTILYVDDSSIGNGLGNTADSLFLLNSTGDTISQMGWNSTIDGTFSLEKIVLSYSDITQNWRQSLSEPGTPGFENSVASQEMDLAIFNVSINPEFPNSGESFQFQVSIGNLGLFENIGILMINQIEYYDVMVIPFDTLTVSIDQSGLPSGIHPFEIKIETAGDYNEENNLLFIDVKVSYEYGDMLINEIMYDPVTGYPEWVEVVNITPASINLIGWLVNDKEELLSVPIAEEYELLTNDYIVISKDSSWYDAVYFEKFPGLNNTDDDIYLYDFTGTMVDHVHYDSDWGGGDGFSLERITHFLESNNHNNWGSSVAIEGSTPFEINSLFIETIQSQGSITLTPNPFSPDDDGFEDELLIAYSLPFTQAYLTMEIFDSAGREIVTLVPGEAVSQDGVVRWNGRFENNNRARVGQYILYVHATSVYSQQDWKTVERIILAKRLD